MSLSQNNVLDLSLETSALTKIDAILIMAAQLKPLPAVLLRLAALVEDDTCTLESISEVIRFEPVLTSRLLRTANSAFSASPVRIGTVENAVLRLGIGLVTSTIASFSVGGMLSVPVPAYGIAAGELWRHSATAAIAAEMLVKRANYRLPPATITAALLHDIGKLIVSQCTAPEEMTFVHRAHVEGGLTFEEAETEVLQMNHAEIGYVIAQHWKMPERICRAIMYHHQPDQWNDPMCDALHIANIAAHSLDAGVQVVPPMGPTMDGAIERLKLDNFCFEEFCEQCAKRFGHTRAIYGV